MKKLSAVLMLSSFLSYASWATCDAERTVYQKEKDDVGKVVALTYTCMGEEKDTEVCVYNNGKQAGLSLSLANSLVTSSELYRSQISSKKDKLSITLKTGLIASAFDYKALEFTLDKSTMAAEVTYAHKGASPFGDKADNKKSYKLKCSAK